MNDREEALVRLFSYLEDNGVRTSLPMARLIETLIVFGVTPENSIAQYDDLCPADMLLEHWQAVIEVVLLEFLPDEWDRPPPRMW
jgi:hypothetical protein